MIFAVTAACVSFLNCDVSSAALVGHWTFEDGSELTDLTGNFNNLVLVGNASVSGGSLNVNGSGATSSGWASAGSKVSSPLIGNKTLISWLTLEQLSVGARAGSALTLDSKSFDQFDGIIFGEQINNRWMSGSNNFARSPHGQFNGASALETGTGDLIQMAITYANSAGNVQITGYRNGVQIGQYTDSDDVTYAANSYEVIFGSRHTFGGASRGGALDALIHEARIYDEVLSQSQIQSLQLSAVAVPEPSGLTTFGLAALVFALPLWWKKTH